MPRLGRLEFKGANYWVQLNGWTGDPIFFNAGVSDHPLKDNDRSVSHVVEFERLLARIGAECATQFIAYCFLSNQCHLVLRTDGAPLHSFIQRLCSQFSRYLRTHISTSPGKVFGSRYQCKVVAPEYLPHAARRVHRVPFDDIAGDRVFHYPFSSARAYLGVEAPLPLERSALMNPLAAKGHSGTRGYREFMNLQDSPYIAGLFHRGSPLDGRVVGGKLFVSQARTMASHPSRSPSKDELIDAVVRQLKVTRTEIHSHSAMGSLGRSLVAWYGLRSGAATLTEMGRWFGITGATLGQTMHHHRLIYPSFFA
jgi:putative transposase